MPAKHTSIHAHNTLTSTHGAPQASSKAGSIASFLSPVAKDSGRVVVTTDAHPLPTVSPSTSPAPTSATTGVTAHHPAPGGSPDSPTPPPAPQVASPTRSPASSSDESSQSPTRASDPMLTDDDELSVTDNGDDNDADMRGGDTEVEEVPPTAAQLQRAQYMKQPRQPQQHQLTGTGKKQRLSSDALTVTTTTQDDDGFQQATGRKKKNRKPQPSSTPVQETPTTATVLTTLATEVPTSTSSQTSATTSAPTPTATSTSPSAQPANKQAQPAQAGSATQQAQEQRQQQPPQQQPQQTASSKRKKLPRPAPVQESMLRSCGVSAISDTSIVVTLQCTAPLSGKARLPWSAIPHPSASNNRAAAATAILLDRLRFRLPPQPQLYAQLSTPQQLADKLVGLPDSQLDHDWYEQLAAASRDGTLGAFLASNVDTVNAATRGLKSTTDWLDVLTSNTNRLNRGQSTSQHNAAAEGRPSDELARCVLRLDFPTPLLCASIAHSLRQLPEAEQTTIASLSAAQPPYTLKVEPYRLRQIAVTVTGFAIGPVGGKYAHPFNSPGELHGNWQLLRSQLRGLAPHCAPAAQARRMYNGVGAVDFVLEQAHLHELYALDGYMEPSYGITRPLKLVYKILRRSEVVACRICRQTGHMAHQCTSTEGETCKACSKPGHEAASCTLPPAERYCAICSAHGHSTAYCHKYRPSYVDTRPAAKPRARSTHSAERAEQMRGGRSYAQVAGATAPQRQTTAQQQPTTDKTTLRAHHSPAQYKAAVTQQPPSCTDQNDGTLLLTQILVEMREDRRAADQRHADMMSILCQLISRLPTNNNDPAQTPTPDPTPGPTRTPAPNQPARTEPTPSIVLQRLGPNTGADEYAEGDEKKENNHEIPTPVVGQHAGKQTDRAFAVPPITFPATGQRPVNNVSHNSAPSHFSGSFCNMGHSILNFGGALPQTTQQLQQVAPSTPQLHPPAYTHSDPAVAQHFPMNE